VKIPKAQQRANGKWRVQITIEGQRISLTDDTEEEVTLKAMNILHGAEQYKKEPLSIALDEAYKRYIESKDSVLAPSTISEYRRMQKNDLCGLMKLPLRDITPEKVQREINKTAKDKSPKYVRNVHGLLVSVLKEYHPNLMLRTTLPQKVRYDAKIPTTEEIKSILQYATGTDIELPIYLSVWLGLRSSEIQGLKWEAYNGKTLAIKEAVVVVDRKRVVKGTKTTSSKRTLPVPPHIKTIIEAQEKIGDNIVPLNRDQIYKRFSKLCKDNELPHFRFHDLRHASASVMLALGIPDKYAMERMGHATNNMLKTVYQHTMEDEKTAIGKRIDEYFEKLIAPDIAPNNTDSVVTQPI